jgi:hypothetical protein
MIRKYALYLIRWQLSTPVLAPIIAWFSGSPYWFGTPETWAASSVANLIGGLIFFWVDRFIFTSKAVEMWHFIPEGKCDNPECGEIAPLWRLTLAPGYDKRKDEPKYLCISCSKAKTDELRAKGIKIKGRSK